MSLLTVYASSEVYIYGLNDKVIEKPDLVYNHAEICHVNDSITEVMNCY
jgi:hypothetical protein